MTFYARVRLHGPQAGQSGRICADAVKAEFVQDTPEPVVGMTNINWDSYPAGYVYTVTNALQDFRHQLNDRSGEISPSLGYINGSVTMTMGDSQDGDPGYTGNARTTVVDDPDMGRCLDIQYKSRASGTWLHAWDHFSRDNYSIKPLGGSAAAVDFPKSAYADPVNLAPGRPPGNTGEAAVLRDADPKVARYDELYYEVQMKFVSGADGTWQPISFFKLFGFGDGNAKQTSHQDNPCYNAEGFYSGCNGFLLLRAADEWQSGSNTKTGYPADLNPMAFYYYSTTSPQITGFFNLDDPAVTVRQTIRDGNYRFYVPPTNTPIKIECRLLLNNAPSTYDHGWDTSSRSCSTGAGASWPNGLKHDWHENGGEVVAEDGRIQYWVTDPRPFIDFASDPGNGECGTDGLRRLMVDRPVRLRLWDRAKISFFRFYMMNNYHAATTRPNQDQSVRIKYLKTSTGPFGS